ncbi:MAG TPA: hypothetical protein VE999_09625 [Gemmataceae bacterium]|nr:hypothetical protein [Gemmataceae bacterium]
MGVAIKPSNQRGRPQQERATSEGPPAIRKGAIAVIYGEPETPRFLAALQRLKRQQRKKERQTRLAKQRVRTVLRKMREC